MHHETRFDAPDWDASARKTNTPDPRPPRRNCYPFADNPPDVSEATIRRRYPESVPAELLDVAEALLDAGFSYPEVAAAIDRSVEAVAAGIARRRNPLSGEAQFILRAKPSQRARLDAIAFPGEPRHATLDRVLDVVEALDRSGIGLARPA